MTTPPALRRLSLAFTFAVVSISRARAAPADTSVSLLRGIIERHEADQGALERQLAAPASAARWERLLKFYGDEARALDAVDFDALDADGRADYLMLKEELRYQTGDVDRERRRFEEVADLLPFAQAISGLEEARVRMQPADPQASAAALASLAKQVKEAREALEKRLDLKDGSKDGAAPAPKKTLALRASRLNGALRETLARWHRFYDGYDPEMTWWTAEPFKAVDAELARHGDVLRKRGAGLGEGNEDAIVGDPIGREALLDALRHEWIAYTPEELIELARRELDWCETELRRAATDMGLGGDWHKALERVKELHVKPGEQPKLIQDLASEAVKFLEDRSLVTIPPLCKEGWRMEMMSAERQKVNPFFTGGEVISVSFPTDAMSHEDKLMSMRGNNVHFSRATVQHELIPGHHLQGFMSERYRTHRRAFRTPFLVEGWALYWELYLWDLGFARSPEDRIGMLFWRAHRCARIIFSLGFHLGSMSADEAIELLVNRVGHERSNATAEVRRSFAGAYGPLYQAAYLLGGLQLRALHREVVESGKMTDRDFHDAVLRENAVPIEFIRASLTGAPLAKDHAAAWKFYGALRGDVVATAAPARPTERPRIYRDRVEPRWIGGGPRFWYRVSLPGDRAEFILVDPDAPSRALAFDPTRAASSLGKALGIAVDAGRLPIESIDPAADGKSVLLVGAEKAWRCDLASYELKEEPRPQRRETDGRPQRGRERPRREREPTVKSPDGRREAFVRGDDLCVRDLPAANERALTSGSSADDSYRLDVQADRAIGLDYEAPDPPATRPEAFWSPDSRKLVAMRTHAGTKRTVYLVDSSPRDQLQPKLQSYPYTKPGDELPVQKPHLFDVESGREVPVADALFPNPWSISDVRWSKDGSRFTFLYNERGHQALRVIEVDATSGQARALVDERSRTFIDYAGKSYFRQLDGPGEIVWMSERDGWNHLYLYDAHAGSVKSQITKGEWVVRGVDRLDEAKRQVWFRAGAVHPGQDPYFVHYCRANLDGTGLTVLTEGDGSHTATFSPDGRFLIDAWSRVDKAPVTELRRAEDGKLVLTLEEADAGEVIASGWTPPERFVAKARDGVTDIYGIIHRPRPFDPSRRYPVVEAIYAGPHGSFVPKSFMGPPPPGDLTSLGFVVVQIDGLGTSNRSKAFHDVCWKNLGDAGFPDRILWMRAAAETRPWMDLTRVGIYGGSAGGQSALRALLAHGDFYKAAVADCGSHDNRMDKVWWNELWMGWPVGPHYAEQSNVTQAGRLTGKLLLMVGELDKNVDPSSTMQVVRALIDSDKDFDLLVMPGAGHGAGASPYGRRRRNEFFQRHLQGIEARPWTPSESQKAF